MASKGRVVQIAVNQIRDEDRESPLSTVIQHVGEWWKVLILHDAFDGFTKFDEFQQNLNLSASTLTSRLKELVADGLLERRQYQEHPPRFDYVLTDLGRSLRPVLVAMAAWGNQQLKPDERSMILVDAETRTEVEPVVVDRATGRRVDGPDFVFTAGPAASETMQARYAIGPLEA
ncbi:winged helix-turn-helix transcriptional regulator [Kribbella deserti]|uniref:Winged helix-turn-helix transcriptional regulator n=1 Tax=Kribbella deserti TaxID=1926257 RepID=A0ABV6QT20_9ACTN